MFPNAEEMYGHFINPEWHAFYRAHPQLIRHDVMARYLFTKSAPHYVDVRVPSTFPTVDMSDDEAAFVRLAMDFGLHQTIGMSFADGAAGRISMLMLNQSVFGSGNLDELAMNHMAEFHLASRYFVEGLSIREMSQEHSTVKLSRRERDCLQWAALGRSTKEIADIMHLTDHTVDEYFASARRKLRATNRSQAVVRAYWLGMIAP